MQLFTVRLFCTNVVAAFFLEKLKQIIGSQEGKAETYVIDTMLYHYFLVRKHIVCGNRE